ncbi:MAG TPA: right-handed parallel beta-helix repeat-containing protein [Bacteroidales bacterium]|nr:right-handed parallel beta-helix repeat-containing protein [Bacteroidales bacterium]HPS26625.1 right-handed parallel beta-helix repeat-containing protein [Bacteroidales bacterium]
MKTKKFILTSAIILIISILIQGQIVTPKNMGKKVENNARQSLNTNVNKGISSTEKNIETKVEGSNNNVKNAVSDNNTTGTSTSASIIPSKNENIIYVSKQNGNNKNPGTKEAPLKNLDKAVSIATSGAEIHVAGGIDFGTLNVGFIESDKPVKIFGSYDETFSTQDINAHPTLIQPDNESARSTRKALLRFTKDVGGTVIDHIVFDAGERNAYSSKEGFVEGIEKGRLLSPTENPPVGYPTVDEPLLSFVSATTGGDVTVQNCVFVNGASFALQAGHRSGKFTVKNNVFVGNRMAAIEIYGTCASTGGPNTMALCGEVEIANNTILFSWSRTKDFLDMGYGIRVMTKCKYNIHHNIIGASILAGVDHTRFNKDEWVKMDNNIFFVNKDKDFHYSPASNTRLRVDAGDFGDLEVASATGNRNEIPKELKVNKAYLEGYLGARYSEKADFDSNSPANQWRSAMGMNKQGTISSNVSMFANKYPWKDALNLFGNVNGVGAQK